MNILIAKTEADLLTYEGETQIAQIGLSPYMKIEGIFEPRRIVEPAVDESEEVLDEDGEVITPASRARPATYNFDQGWKTVDPGFEPEVDYPPTLTGAYSQYDKATGQQALEYTHKASTLGYTLEYLGF